MMFATALMAASEEVRVADARDFDRILIRQKHAFGGPLFYLHFEQIFAVVNRPRHSVTSYSSRPASTLRQRALAGAIGAHDRVYLARA